MMADEVHAAFKLEANKIEKNLKAMTVKEKEKEKQQKEQCHRQNDIHERSTDEVREHKEGTGG